MISSIWGHDVGVSLCAQSPAQLEADAKRDLEFALKRGKGGGKEKRGIAVFFGVLFDCMTFLVFFRCSSFFECCCLLLEYLLALLYKRVVGCFRDHC